MEGAMGRDGMGWMQLLRGASTLRIYYYGSTATTTRLTLPTNDAPQRLKTILVWFDRGQATKQASKQATKQAHCCAVQCYDMLWLARPRSSVYWR